MHYLFLGRLVAAIFLVPALAMSYAQSGLRICELNCENFFDCRHDSMKADQQFLPESPRRWTFTRYWRKQQNIAKEIISMSNGVPPDLVALVEVENDSVLHDLTRRSVLRRAGYEYVMTASADPRGIDVALLYQPSVFRLCQHRDLRLHLNSEPDYTTRDVLYTKGVVFTGDTLHVIVCHFSSKVSGARKSERYRIAEASMVKFLVDSICQQETGARVVILGDFNEPPTGQAITETLQARPCEGVIDKRLIYNLAYPVGHDQRWPHGTYCYQGHWERLDHIFVTGSLLDSSRTLYTSPTAYRIHAPKFILTTDPMTRRLIPFRTYNGYRYQGGYSDHLPVYIDLVTKIVEV